MSFDAGFHVGFDVLTVTPSTDYTYNGDGTGTTGSPQSYLVPAGVTGLIIDAYGAQGGGPGDVHGNYLGGLGGHVRARLPVTPGETLQIRVGGCAQLHNPGGYNGGGGGGLGNDTGHAGGGASDVRRAPYGLADRLIAAGGGGGAQADMGDPGPVVPAYGTGGGGGYPTGSNGAAQAGPASAGKGATQTSGGAAGTGGSLALATSGTLGQGGMGYPSALSSSPLAEGGGGGGGWYGGGGGAETGAGGGGSSGVAGTATALTYDNAVRVGHGLVSLAVAGSLDLLLTSADLTRTSDSDWDLGALWLDPDAEASGLPTASVFGPAPVGGTWSETAAFPHIVVTALPDTGGLLLVTAIGAVSAVTGTARLRIMADAPGWLPIEVPVSQPQTLMLVGNGRVAPGSTADAWVEQQGTATVTDGALAPVFLPAGVRPGQQSDPWGRYWNGDAWVPAVLQGVAMAVGNSHVWDGGDPATTPTTRTLDGGDPATTPTTRTIDGGTP